MKTLMGTLGMVLVVVGVGCGAESPGEMQLGIDGGVDSLQAQADAMPGTDAVPQNDAAPCVPSSMDHCLECGHTGQSCCTGQAFGSCEPWNQETPTGACGCVACGGIDQSPCWRYPQNSQCQSGLYRAGVSNSTTQDKCWPQWQGVINQPCYQGMCEVNSHCGLDGANNHICIHD